jgi:hypothetical protein
VTWRDTPATSPGIVESTLSYALGRSWCVSLRKDANEVAIGFDEGQNGQHDRNDDHDNELLHRMRTNERTVVFLYRHAAQV